MNDILAHHGILGQKWGVRRFQNEDGSLTGAGRKRYLSGEKMSSSKTDSKVTRKTKSDYNTMSDKEFKAKYQTSKETYRKRVNRYGDPYKNGTLAKIGRKLGEKNKKSSSGKKESLGMATSKKAIDLGKRINKTSKEITSQVSKVTSKINPKTAGIIAAALAVPIGAAATYSAARSGRLGMKAMGESFALKMKMIEVAQKFGYRETSPFGGIKYKPLAERSRVRLPRGVKRGSTEWWHYMNSLRDRSPDVRPDGGLPLLWDKIFDRTVLM